MSAPKRSRIDTPRPNETNFSVQGTSVPLLNPMAVFTAQVQTTRTQNLIRENWQCRQRLWHQYFGEQHRIIEFRKTYMTMFPMTMEMRRDHWVANINGQVDETRTNQIIQLDGQVRQLIQEIEAAEQRLQNIVMHLYINDYLVMHANNPV